LRAGEALPFVEENEIPSEDGDENVTSMSPGEKSIVAL